MGDSRVGERMGYEREREGKEANTCCCLVCYCLCCLVVVVLEGRKANIRVSGCRGVARWRSTRSHLPGTFGSSLAVKIPQSGEHSHPPALSAGHVCVRLHMTGS